MASMLDVVMAMIIGGTLMVIIANSSIISSRSATNYAEEQLVQRLLVETTQAIEGDFRNMGYNVSSDTITTVLEGRDSAIAYLSDYNNDGVVDQVKYYLGPPHELSFQNDSLRLIHRQINNVTPDDKIGMCTRFKLKYFTQNETDTIETPVAAGELASIKLVEIILEVQSPYGLFVPTAGRNAFFATTMWRQTRLASQNLKRGE